MAFAFPTVHYACPCTDISAPPGGQGQEDNPGIEDEEEQTFNPHSPRANYNLYPLEHLLFCNECHDIRCPRCYYEEALSYFCPRCLTERPSAEVKTESNRCPQSCHDCPVCLAPLVIKHFETSVPISESNPYGIHDTNILSCNYCKWTSQDIGIEFDKGYNISGQLAKIKNGGEKVQTIVSGDYGLRRETSLEPGKFLQLADFYRDQIEDSTPSTPFRDSPGRLSRLLSTQGMRALKKQVKTLPLMREAAEASEGLTVYNEDEDDEIIERMKSLGWEGVTSMEQRSYQRDDCRFFSDVRPIATTLHSKRVKRCRTCRRQLVRPENKRGSSRYIIKLVAVKYIPRITLKQFDTDFNLGKLRPLVPVQFLLTFRNPIYDAIKVTLATPPVTPGSVASKVTILCPQFDVGPNFDAMDDPLVRRKKNDITPGTGQQLEAGKVWEKGKNWTTIALEVVPGELGRLTEIGKEDEGVDEDVLEIPVFVRLEYETDAPPTDALRSGSVEEKVEKVQREMAYWCVLVVGRIKDTSAE